MNLNLSASVNVFRLLARPALCLPHAVVPTFNDIPIPLDSAFAARAGGRKPDIKVVVLDKDDCFAIPESSEVYPAYEVRPGGHHTCGLKAPLTRQERFKKLREAYPGRRLLIVSNTAGALSHDKDRSLLAAVEEGTGVTVLPHATKKPGCGDEILAYFRAHPETGVTAAHEIAVVGDRLTTDMMLANTMGSWGLWVREGVVAPEKKSVVSGVASS